MKFQVPSSKFHGARVIRKLADPLGALGLLAAQVRGEVDQQLKAEGRMLKEEEDKFTIRRYMGRPVEYQRARCVPSARVRKHRRGLHDVSARPGEVRLKEFVQSEMKRRGLRLTAIYNQVSRGKYPGITVRKVNERASFVTVHSLPAKAANDGSLPGEMTVKAFVISEAERLGEKLATIYQRLRHGKYPEVTVRAVSRNLAFVRVTPMEERREA